MSNAVADLLTAYRDERRDERFYVGAPLADVQALVEAGAAAAPLWNSAPALSDLVTLLKDVPDVLCEGHINPGSDSEIPPVYVETVVLPTLVPASVVAGLWGMAPDAVWERPDGRLSVWWD